MTAARITRIDSLPDGFVPLCEEAYVRGFHHLKVLHEDWNAGTMRFDGPGEGLFAAEFGPVLAGIVGVTEDPYADAGVARVRRLYVGNAHRLSGIGRALLDATASRARSAGHRVLRVRSPEEAWAFYERVGFRRAPNERGATHVLPLSS